MQAVRYWSVRHAPILKRIYILFRKILIMTRGLWRFLGYQRLEIPFAALERTVKGLLFDCQMCGQCILSSTGMSCSMNCPKTIRNGPCGGVRPNGMCEVKADMRCVWMEAWDGAKKINDIDTLQVIQPPIDMRLCDRSSWLSVVKENDPQSSVGA